MEMEAAPAVVEEEEPLVEELVVVVVVSRRRGSFPSGPRWELVAASMDFGRGFFGGSLGGAATTTEGIERRWWALESQPAVDVDGFRLDGLACDVP